MVDDDDSEGGIETRVGSETQIIFISFHIYLKEGLLFIIIIGQ